MSSKCVPPMTPYYKYDFIFCSPPSGDDPLFLENVYDIANTLTEILIVCGIPRFKAKSAPNVMVKSFKFYDKKRHSFDPKTACGKGLSRDHIIKEFMDEAHMTFVEALWAYCVLKRAVKAFFHRTPDHSVRNPICEAVVLKKQKSVWRHAAHRTAQLFREYDQLFFKSQLKFPQCILKLYKDLHLRISKRANPVIVEDYHPRGCVRKVVMGTQSPPKLPHERQVCVTKCNRTEQLKKFIEGLPEKKFPLSNCLTMPPGCKLECEEKNNSPETVDTPPPKRRKPAPKNQLLNLPLCYQCNCPQVICDCDIDPDTAIWGIECSEGPFQVMWLRQDNEAVKETVRPEYHQCPVDCYSSDMETSSDVCSCSDGQGEEEEDENDKDENEDKPVAETADSDNDENLEKLLPTNYANKNQGQSPCNGYKVSKVPPLKCAQCPKRKNK